jgi:hypothetical protein
VTINCGSGSDFGKVSVPVPVLDPNPELDQGHILHIFRFFFFTFVSRFVCVGSGSGIRMYDGFDSTTLNKSIIFKFHKKYVTKLPAYS